MPENNPNNSKQNDADGPTLSDDVRNLVQSSTNIIKRIFKIFDFLSTHFCDKSSNQTNIYQNIAVVSLGEVMFVTGYFLYLLFLSEPGLNYKIPGEDFQLIPEDPIILSTIAIFLAIFILVPAYVVVHKRFLSLCVAFFEYGCKIGTVQVLFLAGLNYMSRG